MIEPLVYDTEQEPYMPEYIDLDHIGKILQEEFMQPYELSQTALAKALGIPQTAQEDSARMLRNPQSTPVIASPRRGRSNPAQ